MVHSIIRVFDYSIISSAIVVAQPLAHEDALEQSVCNEVSHALSIAPTNAPAAVELPFSTNGLSRTQLAIRLVSSQRADGRWFSGTNDVTRSAVKLLNEITE